jgi:hypothetical protein
MTWIDGRSGMVPGVIADGLEALEAMAGDYPAQKPWPRHATASSSATTSTKPTGEYAAMIEALEAEQAKDPAEDREHWLKSSFFLVEARCMLGRELEAQHLARTVSRHLGDADRPAQLEEAFARPCVPGPVVVRAVAQMHRTHAPYAPPGRHACNTGVHSPNWASGWPTPTQVSPPAQ